MWQLYTWNDLRRYESSGHHQLCLTGQCIPLEMPKTLSKVKLLVGRYETVQTQLEPNQFLEQLGSYERWCNRLLTKPGGFGLVSGGNKETKPKPKKKEFHNLVLLNFSWDVDTFILLSLNGIEYGTFLSKLQWVEKLKRRMSKNEDKLQQDAWVALCGVSCI